MEPEAENNVSEIPETELASSRYIIYVSGKMVRSIFHSIAFYFSFNDKKIKTKLHMLFTIHKCRFTMELSISSAEKYNYEQDPQA